MNSSPQCIIKHIHRNFFEAFNRRDMTALASIYGQKCLIHSKSGDLFGPKALIGVVNQWLEHFPELKIYPVFSDLKDDIVTVHWRAESPTQKTEGIFKHPKKNSFHGLTCFRMEKEEVVEHWACIDYRKMNMDASF